MDQCDHKSIVVSADVTRLEDSGLWAADIRLSRELCGEKFRFLGLPVGLDLKGASVSPDGTEGRFAVLPRSEAMPKVTLGLPMGFRIKPVD